MAFCIYENNCISGDYHVGMSIDKDWLTIRTLDKHETELIRSLVKVSLSDDIDITWNNIDKVIDEAFIEIQTPELNRLYMKDTSDGAFDLLADHGYGQNAQSVKDELREVYNLLKQRGKKISIN